MRRTIIFTVGLILLTTLRSMAQQDSKISGTVTDNNNKPLQAVSVSLLKAIDSSLVKATVTNKDGSFEFNINAEGKFILHYSVVGYDTKFSEIFSVKGAAHFTENIISLTPVSNKLLGVTINSKKPLIEVRADKTVFNVEASINATGSNAYELLQKSPGMTIDNNDNITMKGKTGVKVYVDGKMTQLDTKDLAAYLKSINSNDIEAIEMISNPSAKYDASGNAGIVNIRLKKNKKFGTNGSANLGLVQGITPKGNGSVALNYRDKKVNLFSNIAGGNIGRYENDTYVCTVIQKDTVYNQLNCKSQL